MRLPVPETLFMPGANCCPVTRADRVALLVDGADYFSAFRKAAERAQRSIFIVGWDFDSGALLDPTSDKPVKLGDFLNGLARRNRRLRIRILNWDYPVLFGADRELPPAYGLSWKPHRQVQLHYDDTHPVAGSQHQKIVLIDDRIAFVGGLDLACKRWDTSEHEAQNAHRVASGKPYPPFHDMMALVDGEAARVLSTVVRSRWRRATGEALDAAHVDNDPWPASVPVAMEDTALAVACTEPGSRGKRGIRHVERLYLDLIARARRTIYIENQYFTSHVVGDALARRLAEPDGPEIVLVTRLLSHGWLEEMTMHVLRTRLIQRLRQADIHGRFQVYYPHVEGLLAGTCVDVHSKMMAVDDEWLRVGSSNLSNRSMGLDTECDLVFEARGEARVSRVILAFRSRLLGEHLGVEPAQVEAALEATGSLHKAIASLQRPEGRSLRVLEDLKDWPQTLVEAIAVTDPEQPVPIETVLAEIAPVEETGRRPWGRIAAVVALIAGCAMLWRYTPLADWFTVDKVTAWASDFGRHWWAPIVVVLAYLPASLLLVPRPLITLAATVAFGAWFAFLYATTGILFAGGVTYSFGRLLHPDAVRRVTGARIAQVAGLLREHGLPAVIAVRFVPIAPFWVVNMSLGAIRVKFWHFVVGTTIGVMPGILAATVFGDQLNDALHDPRDINYGVLALLAAFFIGVLFFARRWVARVRARADARRSVLRASQAAQTTPRPSRWADVH